MSVVIPLEQNAIWLLVHIPSDIDIVGDDMGQWYASVTIGMPCEEVLKAGDELTMPSIRFAKVMQQFCRPEWSLPTVIGQSLCCGTEPDSQTHIAGELYGFG